MRDDLHLPGVQAAVEVGHCGAERLRGLFDRHRLGDDPDARLVSRKSLTEIRNENFEQIVFRLVELAKVRSPRHTVRDEKPCLAQPFHFLISSQLEPIESDFLKNRYAGSQRTWRMSVKAAAIRPWTNDRRAPAPPPL
jgi:hypothetical protein